MKAKMNILKICVLVLGLLLMHNNCGYQAKPRGHSEKSSTIIGNPLSRVTVASFEPTSLQILVKICAVGMTLKSDSSLTPVHAEFPTPQEKEILKTGVIFDSIHIPPGHYTEVKLNLAPECGDGTSVAVSNSSGNFESSQNLTAAFLGEVKIVESHRVTFNIQSIYDRVSSVKSSSELSQKLSSSYGLVSTENMWAGFSMVNVPQGRAYHASVWTGRELMVWGGYSTGQLHNTGGRYDPTLDTWTSIATVGAPEARYVYGSVWTGSKMLVWGGVNSSDQAVATGALYDPNTNSWTDTSTSGAPSARMNHTVVWTGSRALVWGGEDTNGNKVNTGGIYDPVTNSWEPISTLGAPSPRVFHSAVWTGSEMLIWGGCNDPVVDCTGQNPGLSDGARYNPQTDTWTPISTSGAPSSRYSHTALWTGTEMILWSGGRYEDPFGAYLVGDGGRYNPATDSWKKVESDNKILPRVSGVAVWTGSKILIWGGRDLNFNDLNSSALFDPSTNTWESISPQNAPAPRTLSTAIWTGFEILLWGGKDVNGYLTTGGRYRP